MKKLFCLLACAVLLLCCGCSEKSYPEPTSDFFVNDFADVLSSSDKSEMQSTGEALYNATTAQLVVAVVDDLGGEDIDDYSINLATKWGIGQKGKDNGVLLILAVEDRKVKIEVGTGLEGALPDSKTGRILDTYGVPYFKNDNFSQGLLAVYKSLALNIYNEYGITPPENVEQQEPENTEQEEDTANIITVVIIFVIVVIILSTFFNKRRMGGPPFIFFGPGGFGGGRGGFGGGGFSGGGGGFSGGGGGFSGGGSSRGF